MSRSLSGFGFVKFGLIVILWGAVLLSAPAAEIRLKRAPIQCSDTLVTLTDIADVLPMEGDNEETVEMLRQTVLFPAPDDGGKQTIDQHQLRTMLSQLGISSLHHFISGAEKVIIRSMVPRNDSPVNPNEQFVIQANYLAPSGKNAVVPIPVRTDAPTKVAGITDEIVWTLEEQIAQALNVYLNFTNKTERSWEISLKLTPEQVKLLATNGQIMEITGGQIPFTGTQQFHIRMQSDVTVTVEAAVTLPVEIVIMSRTLPKGYILTESDVMLQRVDKLRGDDFFVDIQSVVGKEIVKPVRELHPLTQSDVRLPLWVRKGEIVTVRAKSGGIAARSEVTALQDGVEGDTITVAYIDTTLAKKGKKADSVTYLARVCAPKTVEVFVK